MHVEVTARSGFENCIDRLEIKTLVAGDWGNLGFILLLSMWNLGCVLTVTLETLVAGTWGILGFILFVSMWNLGSVR